MKSTICRRIGQKRTSRQVRFTGVLYEYVENVGRKSHIRPQKVQRSSADTAAKVWLYQAFRRPYRRSETLFLNTMPQARRQWTRRRHLKLNPQGRSGGVMQLAEVNVMRQPAAPPAEGGRSGGVIQLAEINLMRQPAAPQAEGGVLMKMNVLAQLQALVALLRQLAERAGILCGMWRIVRSLTLSSTLISTTGLGCCLQGFYAGGGA
jgi:hypothetical protein